jgi:hypothetical protein
MEPHRRRTLVAAAVAGVVFAGASYAIGQQIKRSTEATVSGAPAAVAITSEAVRVPARGPSLPGLPRQPKDKPVKGDTTGTTSTTGNSSTTGTTSTGNSSTTGTTTGPSTTTGPTTTGPTTTGPTTTTTGPTTTGPSTTDGSGTDGGTTTTTG